MKKIVTYLIITFILSLFGYYLIINSKKIGVNAFLGMFYLMWCPAISGIITSLIYEKSLAGMGWRLGKPRWSILAYLLPILYAAIAYGLIWLSGLGGINPNYRINIFVLTIFGTALNVAFAAGEEIGWRGFLVPQLYKLTGFTTTCVVSGVIWAVWHFPLVISGIYLAKMPVGPQLLLMVLTITAMTFPISWLRLRSGSVWPAVFLHASHNLYIQWLFDPLTTETGPLSKYMIGESGIMLAVVFIVIAIIFWNLRNRIGSASF